MNHALTIQQALAEARSLLTQSETASLDAELLLAHVLGVDRLFLKKEPEHRLSPERWAQFQHVLQQRQAGRPLAYVLGHKSFWSFNLRVTPDVLVPRPETECLVETVLNLLPETLPYPVLELGTGSGAISLALALERPHWRLVATDLSPAALAIAKENAATLGVNSIEFCTGDWFQAVVNRGPFAAIVSNPPYIAARDPHLKAAELQCEPFQALCSGASGLEALQRIIEQAKRYLVAGGWLCLEHGHDQSEILLSYLRENGYHRAQGFSDFANVPRVMIGKL